MENIKHEHNLYIIKSLKTANYLVRAGFDIVVIGKNDKEENKITFLFEDTPEFRKTLTEYSRKNR